uniref:Single-stranded DNA binding protein Ssb-like OB fold domain-containing protein n=1 Tax=Aegilops tauschii subsp. strangulata TaxID=200361 RepID=A0A452XHP8_AEGTS
HTLTHEIYIYIETTWGPAEANKTKRIGFGFISQTNVRPGFLLCLGQNQETNLSSSSFFLLLILLGGSHLQITSKQRKQERRRAPPSATKPGTLALGPVEDLSSCQGTRSSDRIGSRFFPSFFNSRSRSPPPQTHAPHHTTRRRPSPLITIPSIGCVLFRQRAAMTFDKVEELRPGTYGHNLQLRVLSAKPVVLHRPQGGRAGGNMRIAECIVGDDTGVVVFTARNEQGSLPDSFIHLRLLILPD